VNTMNMCVHVAVAVTVQHGGGVGRVDSGNLQNKMLTQIDVI